MNMHQRPPWIHPPAAGSSDRRARHGTRWVAATVGAAALVLLAGTAHASPAPTAPDRLPIEAGVHVPVRGGVATIDPRTLAVGFTPTDGEPVAWSAPSPTRLGSPTAPVAQDGVTSWGFADSDLRVSVSEQDGRLDARLDSPSDRRIVWPVTATDPSATSIEFPNGEGQSIPVDDPFWRSDESHLLSDPWTIAENLTMPFWGTTLDGRGVSYIAHGDLGTDLDFDAPEERITASATHEFDAAAGTSSYRVTIAATDGNPVAAGQDFRAWLLSQDGLVTLDEKIAENPEAERLVGAFHAYLWKDAGDASIIERLQALGIENAWLGFDRDVADMSRETVQAVADAGYLAGPYDTWENAQDPATADGSVSIWPGGLWPDGCALDEHGEPIVGFGGRGCVLSGTALEAAEASDGVLSDRVREFSANGVTSYFLDVDATGSLTHDHSPDHPQTWGEDRANRIERMGALASGGFSNGRPFVLGSEKAEWWANPVISFSHGSSTPISNGIWMLQKDKDVWGSYWPADRPAFFFKPVALSDSLAKEMFDPRYRVPLYETVLHDSVVSTDRWEMGLYKFAGLERTRILTNLLYNTPAMLSLDHGVLDEHGEEIADMQAFFGIIQDAAGTDAMTSFERLGADVQRTTFGNADGSVSLTITANFGASDTPRVAAGCVLAAMPDGMEASYCP